MNISKEMRLHQWAHDMAEQKSSGLSQLQWCKMKGIGTTTFEYRCRKVREAMEQKLSGKAAEENAIVPAKKNLDSQYEKEPCFAKINLTGMSSSSSGIQIKFRDILFNIAPDSPTEHLRMVLEVISNVK